MIRQESMAKHLKDYFGNAVRFCPDCGGLIIWLDKKQYHCKYENGNLLTVDMGETNCVPF